jgi:cytochrome P450
MREVPKVKTWLLFFAIQFAKDSIGYLEKLQKQYGDVFYKNIRGHKQFFLQSPVYAEHILSKNQENYQKHPVFVENFAPFLGRDNLLATNDLSQWKQDREICQTVFEPTIFLEQYTQQMTKNFEQAFARFQEQYAATGLSCPIGRELDILALKNINDTIFHNIDIDIESLIEHIPEIFHRLSQKSLSATRLPWIFPSKRKRAYDDEVRYLQEVKRKALLSRIRGGKEYDDLLSTLISRDKITGEQCPHFARVANHMMTFNVVGYSTTTSALRWIVTSLVENPEVEKKISEEVLAVCGTSPPTYADLEKLHYTKAAVAEILRLNPPLAFVFREAVNDDVLVDLRIQKGNCIFLNLFQVHRHPEYWEHPDAFQPERFLAKPCGQDNPFAYVPFGSGKRICIARNFALMELQLFTAMIVQRFQMFFPQDYQVKRAYVASVFLRPNIQNVFLKPKKR